VKINSIEIANFRKLKSVRIDLASQTTLFVGANNSGKTTAMEAIRQFLSEGRFDLTDFSLSSLPPLQMLGRYWEGTIKLHEALGMDEAEVTGDSLPAFWASVLPTIDIWVEAKESELYRVEELLPILEDYVGGVGVRLRYEPKDLETLKKTFLARRAAAISTLGGAIAFTKDPKEAVDEKPPARLWPADLVDYLSEDLESLFTIHSYKLDPSLVTPPLKFGSSVAGKEGDHALQRLSPHNVKLGINPLKRILTVDIVNAQRGLGSAETAGRLSSQVAKYYEAHLDPSRKPEAADLAAIQATQSASRIFDARLMEAFEAPLKELARMGYPGGKNPNVIVKTLMQLTDGLKHNSVLRYQVGDISGDDSDLLLELPEGLNGLGYQNLVLMIFNLMSFRDARRKTGKAGILESGEDPEVKPLHLVLVEEPEAHLHAQVQQVFINQAYRTLTSGSAETNLELQTQLIVSTHSSHIAHELDFKNIRYFRRETGEPEFGIPITTVRNLSSVFGAEDATSRFVQRYLKLQHCNIFFADALIMMEGAAERILLPHFVESHHPAIAESYVEYLEIGGAHAHRLRALVDLLGIPTLVITDIDSVDSSRGKKARPERGLEQMTSNSTLKKWLAQGNAIDVLSALLPSQKVLATEGDGHVRFAFQTDTDIQKSGVVSGMMYPSTFEDALALANLDTLSDMQGTGILAKFAAAAKDFGALANSTALSQGLYDAVQEGDKAEFALDVLWNLPEGKTLDSPHYIREGLDWLEERVRELPILTTLLPTPDVDAELGARETTN
jgi:predicted ATP-dependent endonuclease of OLD family